MAAVEVSLGGSQAHVHTAVLDHTFKLPVTLHNGNGANAEVKYVQATAGVKYGALGPQTVQTPYIQAPNPFNLPGTIGGTGTSLGNALSNPTGNDSISLGSGSDTVVQAGQAALNSIGGTLADSVGSVLAADSVATSSSNAGGFSAAHDLQSVLGAASAPLATDSSVFGFGADSVGASHLVSSFAAAPAVTSAVANVAAHGASSVVSMDGGLTTIDLHNLTTSTTAPKTHS